MVSTPVKWLFQLYYCMLHIVSIHFNVLSYLLWLSFQVHCVFQVDAGPWFFPFLHPEWYLCANINGTGARATHSSLPSLGV